MKSKTTHVLFKNEKVTVNYDNDKDYYSIIANHDIEIGTFIVLEHVISKNDQTDIYTCMMKDDDLFNYLYPRKIDTSDADELFNELNKSKDSEPIDYDSFVKSYKVQLKIMNNIFMFNEKYVLCNFISKFNHSCIPNCHMDCADNVKDNMFYGIWTHRRIKKNEELTIDYCQSANITHHNNMKEVMQWSCNCSDEFIEANSKRAVIHMNLGTSFIKRDINLIHNLVDKYMISDIAKNVISTQSLKMNIVNLRR
jgi:SET domain